MRRRAEHARLRLVPDGGDLYRVWNNPRAFRGVRDDVELWIGGREPEGGEDDEAGP